MHLVPILIQPVRREDSEKSRNARGRAGVKIAGRTLNIFEICRRYNIYGRKKAELANKIRMLKRESEKVGPYFSIKRTQIMTIADCDSFDIDR